MVDAANPRAEDQIAAVTEARVILMTGMMDLRDQVKEGTLSLEEAFAAAALLRDDFDAALRALVAAPAVASPLRSTM